MNIKVVFLNIKSNNKYIFGFIVIALSKESFKIGMLVEN